MYHYHIAGLTVTAGLELPGVHPRDAGALPADLQMDVAPLAAHLNHPRLIKHTWELDAQQFLLTVPGICRVLARQGQALAFEPAPGTSAQAALPLVLSTGVAAILLQRGALVLRGAAVAFKGRAYVICGVGGQGKSTLAAALCRAGAAFICDDMCAMGVDADGQAVVWADASHLKLAGDSIDYLQLGTGRGTAVRAGVDKYYVAPPVCGVRPALACMFGPLPIAGVYILRDVRTNQTAGIEALPRLAAAQILHLQAYRADLAAAMMQSNRPLQATAALLRPAGVYMLTRRRELAVLDDTVAELLRHWGGADV